MAAGMPDIHIATTEACREMSAPTRASWKKLKRIGRYLVGRSRVAWKFPWKEEVGNWQVYTDSDWAGDLKTRKSTSGGMIALGSHCLKSWSITQGAPALSSCEAEYYAIVEGATRALGMQTAAQELGVEVSDMAIESTTDSSGAKSFASRRGTGRIRHIEVKWLWLQQAVAEGRFRMRKIDGKKNPADVCTKYLSLREAKEKLVMVNIGLEGKSEAGARDKGGGHQPMEEPSSGLGTSCAWLHHVGPRLVWADAEDSEAEEEDIEAAVGACAFCGARAADCRKVVGRGGVSSHPPSPACASVGKSRVAHGHSGPSWSGAGAFCR